MRGALAGAPGVTSVAFDATADRFLVAGSAGSEELASRVRSSVLAPGLRRWLGRSAAGRARPNGAGPGRRAPARTNDTKGVVASLARLITRPELVQAALDGRKTEQRRQRRHGNPGDRFELEGALFELVRVERQRLGDMSDADARAEGYASLEAYRSALAGSHGADVWQADAEVWVHAFRRVPPHSKTAE